MDERMARNTSVRLREGQRNKLDLLSRKLNTSRNRVFGLLIDAAEIQSQPAVSVEMNNRRDAQNLTGSSITAVGA